MKHLIIALALISATPALAQETRNFYGSNGQYLGQAQTYGNTTNFYGRNGQYEGQAQTNSFGSTNFYGKNGNYQGQMDSSGF